jgi:membrane-bound metal-dependent hydrolase YbcI (DUF457 family)
MQKYTHLVFGGLTAALVAHFFYGVSIDLTRDWNMILALQYVKSVELPLRIFTESTPFIIQGAILGILPDLDHIFKGLLAHRCGLTHSIFTFTIFMPVLAYAFAMRFELPQYLVTLSAICVFSHWLIDALNPSGVRTIGFYPSFLWRHRCDLRLAKIRYNNHLANLVFCAVCVGVLFLLGSH